MGKGIMRGFKVDTTRRNARALMPRRSRCAKCRGRGWRYAGTTIFGLAPERVRCKDCGARGFFYEFWSGSEQKYLRGMTGDRVRMASPDVFAAQEEAVSDAA